MLLLPVSYMEYTSVEDKVRLNILSSSKVVFPPFEDLPISKDSVLEISYVLYTSEEEHNRHLS